MALIYRQAALDKFKPWLKVEGYSEGELNMLRAVIYELENLPDAEHECWNCKHQHVGIDEPCFHCTAEEPKWEPIEPYKRGKWIPEHKGNGYGGYYRTACYCSCCKDYYTQSPEEMNFCPHCGADMRTKETDCDYERAVEQLEHDMLYEPTFDPDDGSM